MMASSHYDLTSENNFTNPFCPLSFTSHLISLGGRLHVILAFLKEDLKLKGKATDHHGGQNVREFTQRRPFLLFIQKK